MDYNALRVARAEHERMVRSVPQVSEYGEHIVAAQPRWLSRQAHQLLSILKQGLAMLRSRATLGHNRGLNKPLAEYEAR
jgi:hypothetical protein